MWTSTSRSRRTRGAGARANLVRPFPGYGAIIMRETTARSRYHGLLASFRHEAGRAGSATVNYTFSRNKADATYDNSSVDDPQNPLDKDAEFAAAGTDRTQSSTRPTSTSCRSRATATRGWRKALWRVAVAGITRIESGPAARIRSQLQLRRLVFPESLRPNQVGDPAAATRTVFSGSIRPRSYLAGREYGDAPVAPFRLPGRHQWDFAVSKNMTLAGTRRLQFRADLINAFNQTQFLDVSTYCASLCGTTTCESLGPSGFGKVTSTRPPREIQFGVRFDW